MSDQLLWQKLSATLTKRIDEFAGVAGIIWVVLTQSAVVIPSMVAK